MSLNGTDTKSLATAAGVETEKCESSRIPLQGLVLAQHDHWESVLVPVTSTNTTAQYFPSFDRFPWRDFLFVIFFSDIKHFLEKNMYLPRFCIYDKCGAVVKYNPAVDLIGF